MELCLGTVQFGMDYGIRNQKQPTPEEAVAMLTYATEHGIRAIDTAEAYGTAEVVVGEFLQKKTVPRESLFISTKMEPNELDVVSPEEYVTIIERHLTDSLARLHTDYTDVYLLHSARYAHRKDILDALYEVQKKGLAKRVGVSVYEPDEAFACMEHKDMGFIQAPYSLFDQRMKVSGVIDKARETGMMLATRSAFIQGLIAMQPDEVPSFLEKAKPILAQIDAISKESGYSRIELAIGYVKKAESLSHLVFGVDNMEQLVEDIETFEKDLPDDLYDKIEKTFENLETDIVMPSLWKPKD